MHVRKVVKTGNGLSICLPFALVRFMKIERADYLAIQIVDDKSFLFSKIDSEKIPELMGLSGDDLPQITYKSNEEKS